MTHSQGKEGYITVQCFHLLSVFASSSRTSLPSNKAKISMGPKTFLLPKVMFAYQISCSYTQKNTVHL